MQLAEGPEKAARLRTRQFPGEWMFIRSWARGTGLSGNGLKIDRLPRLFDVTARIAFQFTLGKVELLVLMPILTLPMSKKACIFGHY